MTVREELSMLDQALCSRIADLSLNQRMPEGSRTQLLLRLAGIFRANEPHHLCQDQLRKLHNGKARTRPSERS